MISARDFCKETGYPVTIFLTYAFDPLFFERIPLEDLGIGGTRRIVILGDAAEIGGAMERCAGQIFHLGRRYTLAEAKPSNLFHPKLIARLSPERGKVWIGSGNLTYTGWGGNHELAVGWPIGPGSDDNGAWLSDVLRSVATVTRSESFHTQMEIIRAAVPWLSRAATGPAPSPVLLGMPGRPLAPQLAQRWQGRRFKTLKMYTGSTDVDGAFLRWAHDTFGLKKATICLTPSFASFDAKQLAKLPLEVRFVERDPKRRVHAKFCWFSGPDGDAAVMGSANCSAAAWLANHANGNVELITIYDAAERNAFAPILADFDGEERLPKDFLSAPAKPEELPADAQGGVVYRLTSLRLRPSGRTLEARVEPVPDAEPATLVFEVKQKTYRIAMTRSGNRYSGRLAEDMSLGAETVFAALEIPSGSAFVTTPPRWIDNERAIENAARNRDVDPNQKVFSGRGFAGASEQQIIEAIHSISTSLFNFETPDLTDLTNERKGPDKNDAGADAEDGPAGPVDPSKLIYDLNDETSKSGTHSPDQDAMHGVSLRGVMRLLFASDDEHEVDLSQERWTADEPEANDASGGMVDSSNTEPPPPVPPVQRSDAEALATLLDQIEQFLFGLAKPKFAEGCPAETFSQAVVFPILVAIKLNEKGWLPDYALASVACRVVTTMFSKTYGRDKPRGLFRQVQARHASPEKRAEFLKAVGDGALYTVLLAALAKPVARSLGATIQQATAITEVMNCADLVATSHPDQRSALAKNVILQNAGFAIGTRAPALASAMATLTALMQAWDRAHPGRATRSTMQRAGSILWMSPGWEVTPRSPAETYCSGVNIEGVASGNPDVALAVAALHEAMELTHAAGPAAEHDDSAADAVA
ncbi:phospholipase D family protein [Bradyrhizobium sp. CCGUVB14]|uniref:phospholipase D family protein n=1 Tax=Bradyrhizobium sp. CCGUVB14 TaxID=2949628 RepID=UPI0020B2BC19|nr:phospholipase D family protein [Bradyrhizobium sp. CCGUVB14]MCP3447348.1 phospholipase D family protein [Bradyrhizobium sp. CCGUVB14]